MMLHTPAFEVLDGAEPAGELFVERLGDRIAEALQPAVRLPIREERSAETVPGLDEVAAARGHARGARECLPWAALRLEYQRPQPAGQHALGAVILQPVALEPLHRARPAFDRLDVLIAGRVAEDDQPTIALPIAQDRARHAVAGLGEAACARCGAG